MVGSFRGLKGEFHDVSSATSQQINWAIGESWYEVYFEDVDNKEDNEWP